MPEVDAHAPRVIAGLPVYNGETYLERALDSLLGQDYPELEIIISDNASTDGTEAIGRAYATAHPSIRYVRQSANLGAGGNFDYLRQVADSEYFFWAGAHDLWDPRFVSELVDVLERKPDLIGAYPAGRFLEEDGALAERMGQPYSYDHPSAAWRYIKVVARKQLYAIYGVFRREVLQSIDFWQGCIGPDILQVNQLVLKGPVAAINEELFYMRRVGKYGSAVRYCANLGLPFGRRHVFRYIVGYQRNHVKLAFMELPRLQAMAVSVVVTPLFFMKSLRLYAGLITEAFAPHLMERIRARIRCR